jgi:hypothetical protein
MQGLSGGGKQTGKGGLATRLVGLTAIISIASNFQLNMLWCGIDILHRTGSRWGCSDRGDTFSDYRVFSFPYRFGANTCCDDVGLVAGTFRQA